MKNHGLSPLPSGKWSFGRFSLFALLLGFATLGLVACQSQQYLTYKFPQFTFANRPVPPSRLKTRVMVSIGNAGLAGTGGALQMLDATRDIRFNIANTSTTFPISGYAAGQPIHIYNFPEEVHGYVYSNSDGSLQIIDYSKESQTGSAGLPTGTLSNSIGIPTDGQRIFAAQPQSGQLIVIDNGKIFPLNLPNVYQVAANTGDTVAIAMVRNSDTLYQVYRLNNNQFPTAQAAIAQIGAVDCQPLNTPVYCVVPVTPPSGSVKYFDRPIGAYFSLDGTTAYILNCGPECGGTTASITILQQGALNINNLATSTVIQNGFQGNIPTPGGATDALADGSTLYVAGQQLQPDGLFAGKLTTINLANQTITGTYSISDGTHNKMLFGDDNTLWIGSQYCATGERAKLGQNYNCLTRFDRGANSASIIPNVTPGDPNHTVPYPNTNLDQYYYGDLTGLCWVQNLHKMYTAYGGQVHAFNTADGSEINNQNITVQGTALDVAYMDAITNDAN